MSHDLTKYAILKIACDTPKIFFAFIYLHLQFKATRPVLEIAVKIIHIKIVAILVLMTKFCLLGCFFFDKSCGIVCTVKKITT